MSGSSFRYTKVLVEMFCWVAGVGNFLQGGLHNLRILSHDELRAGFRTKSLPCLQASLQKKLITF